MWAVEHDTALNWAFRATTDAVFDGVHLDVEPWTLPGWPRDAPAHMASYAALVEGWPRLRRWRWIWRRGWPTTMEMSSAALRSSVIR